MRVTAAPGLKCPMEGKPREYITESGAVEVPNTNYYRRLLREGSLSLVPVEKKAIKTPKGDK